MVVCYEKKCIFIHIPKTGGSSVEQFIKDGGRNSITYIGVQNNRSLHHYTAIELRKDLPILFRNYYKFSIVRNPYDRLLSEYYWTPIQNVGYKAGKTKREFLQYVENTVKNQRYFTNIYNDHFIPQYNFIYEDNKLLVDQLFKFEDLEWVSNYLKRRLEISIKFPVINKQNIKKEGWNNRQKERIYNLYKTDFILLGYDKN